MTRANCCMMRRAGKMLTYYIAVLVLTLLLCDTAIADGSSNAVSEDFADIPAWSATAGISDSIFTGDGGEISLEVRDADLRDVLSALAVKLGVNIILTNSEPVSIDFKVKNITARKALELIIENQKMAYLQNGNIILVGDPGTLKSDFFNQMLLVKFDLYYIQADKIKDLIGQLGVDQTNIMVDTNPNAIWVQGTAQTLQKVRELIYAVDEKENQLSLDYKALETYTIPPDRLVELMARAGVVFKRYVILDNRLLVFDRELFPRWEELQKLTQQLDVNAAQKNKAFVFQLKNIAAGDAKTRLDEFGFTDVQAEAYNYDRLGHELMVICPPYLETQVRAALVSLDQTREKTKVPLLTGSYDQVNSMRSLLSELSGVSASYLHISRNIADTTDSDNREYVLWVEETPDKAQLIKDLIEEIGGGSGGESGD
ncbi:type IV pilus assembly protein PilQ [Desulfotomaculum arcticum]|uniref:Type IV pilus assembly protein PilQ n=2 Tax=Desulfotruncus TaxID=2867377 RepID=A0A1I2MNX9_9FIRM|nr:type IV pilus assembly protein PilQ [Desulfotomaculum arcticum] [Desulfotruncus arcticus DSM 17038]